MNVTSSLITQDEIKQLHCGLIACHIREVAGWMPEVQHIIDTCTLPHGDYIADIKVHMLMPGQFPCIPGWHGDFVPRDENLNLMPEKIDDTQRMFLWISGPPITEFEDGRRVVPGEWVEFGQRDQHRGCVSDAHQWRLFIRLAPVALARGIRTGESVLRRHSQVYLDSKNFSW